MKKSVPQIYNSPRALALNLKTDKIRYLYKKLKIMDTKKEKKKVFLDFEKKIYGIPNFVGYQIKWLLTP